ncbi:MAG: flagellar brake domain-containing protein [Clostridiales bacterium]|nr:flagellar brake domain-containing protein [Clostridiales bacterium]
MQIANSMIAEGDEVEIRSLLSFAPEGDNFSERVYKSEIQEIYDNGTLKLRLPVEYGDIITLSLDRIYEICIITDQETYRSKGRIVNRFKNEGGASCIFRMTEALSRETRKRYITCDARIPTRYAEMNSQRTGHGMITSMSIERMVMTIEEFLDEGTLIEMEASFDNGREITFTGRVCETIRLRTGEYESEIDIDAGDFRQQKELARWLLRHYESEILK